MVFILVIIHFVAGFYSVGTDNLLENNNWSEATAHITVSTCYLDIYSTLLLPTRAFTLG